MPPLRVIFFGTAELACASLAALAKEPAFRVLGVVTQPDRPKGRDLRLQPPPVKVLASRLGLPVWQPERCRQPEFVEHLRSLAPELIVVAAYGQLLPPAILTLPPHGCVNVHASLLPRHRGAAPIQWALLEGDAETGVTLMQMDAGLDTGDILSRVTTPITADDNAQTLHDRLATLGAELLVRTLPDLVAGRISPRPQPAEGVSYARKITKDDGRLDWRLPADVLWHRVRAFTPWPGAFTFLPATPQPVRLKIWRAEPAESAAGHAGEILSAAQTGVVVACGSGALRLLELQREGGRRLPAAEFLAGHALPAGTVLA
jgi:methionyl-tRNA formyltransferase